MSRPTADELLDLLERVAHGEVGGETGEDEPLQQALCGWRTHVPDPDAETTVYETDRRAEDGHWVNFTRVIAMPARWVSCGRCAMTLFTNPAPRCGARNPSYSGTVTCQRTPGHEDRHCDFYKSWEPR